MKRHLIIRVILFAGLAPLVILNLGCPSKIANPTFPNDLIAAPTPVTPNPNGPLIEFFHFKVAITGVNNGEFASLFIVDNNGNPVTTAAVTLNSPTTSFALPYLGVGTSNPPANMGITNINGGEYAGPAIYLAGENYSVNLSFGGTTYTAQYSPINVSATYAGGASGVTFTWAKGGNENAALAVGNDNLQFGPSPAITSPYIIPAATFVDDPAGQGNDSVFLMLLQATQPAFTGCNALSVVGTGIEVGSLY